MTLKLKDLLADVLRRHPKILLTELASILEDEIEERVQDRVAELRERLESGDEK